MGLKVVILCGGLGSRLAEETKIIPKPLVRIGKYPILYHVMNIYSKYGHNEFVLALGYKGKMIKEYFLKNKIEEKKKWKIKFCFTGLKTLTGTRIKKLSKHLKKEKNFFCTYGDGLSNININKLLKTHLKSGKISTLTAVHPPARFGEIYLKNRIVKKFIEKPQIHSNWINGGFFVFKSAFIKYIKNKNVMLEREPIQSMIRLNQLGSYKHHSFWQCMDTLRDKNLLNEICKKNKIAPWEEII